MKKIVIYKNEKTGYLERAYQPDFGDQSPQIIWQGDNWEEFEQQTGLEEKDLLGLKIVNNKIVFDSQQAEDALKKTLTGDVLYKTIAVIIGEDWPREGKNDEQIAQEIKSIMNSFNENRGLIESQSEITQTEYNAIKKELVKSFTANVYAMAVPGFLNALETRLNNSLKDYKFKQ